MSGSSACLGCRAKSVDIVLDLGRQPPSNRFTTASAEDQDGHRLQLGVCMTCGLVQLVSPMPPDMVKSRFPWMSYQEPEAHLDGVVDRLCELPGVSTSARIMALTYKDDTTVDRLRRRGMMVTARVDMADDLGIVDPCAGLETIQHRLDPARAEALRARHGPADIFIVRHVVEHAHDPLVFLTSLRRLIRAEGYVVIEVPDASKFLAAHDYSFLWEEHLTYFTPASLGAMARACHFDVVEIITCPFALEDSLVAILKPAGPGSPHLDRAYVPSAVAAARQFGSQFASAKIAYRSQIQGFRTAGRRVAVFGAGHLAAKFINFLDIAEFLEFVIDDNPQKQTLLMPGSKLPIVGSSSLDRIDVCLLSLSPESERKVVAKYQDFTARGGVFGSIFALSPLSMRTA